ncbi:MAG TPA: hypothetical protein VJQ25_00080, partial [Nitrospira sp.]|nr:hypothetical protein [Nitrospira sp.]
MLPVAFSHCVSSKRTVTSARQQHSLGGAHMVFALTSGLALLEKETPQTYQEAMMNAKAKDWIKAMRAEYDGCLAAKTWDEVP